MVGICGVLGESGGGIEPLAAPLGGGSDEVTTTFVDDEVSLHVAGHARVHDAQPARTADGRLVWVHGRIYGCHGPDGYEPGDRAATNSERLARLLDERGLDVLADVNGEFAAVVLEAATREAHLVTDRLGSVPLYHTHTGTGRLFASRLQAIGLHPDVEPRFDREALAEFFAVQKAFGTATVLEDVRAVPPASVLTIGLDGTRSACRTYWQPRYRPVDRSPGDLAGDLADTVARVIRDRVRDDLEYGVMLSGGSDSRLVLDAAIDAGASPTAFHLTNWESRETRAAERVADAAGVEFRRLRRDADYHADLLERVPASTNFVGAFDEYVASGFADELGEVDVLLSGYLGDTMFGRYPLYLRSSPLPFELSIEAPPASIADYVERYLARYETPAAVPAFLDAPDVETVLADRIGATDGAIDHHGVRYGTLRELQLCEYYPLTNQYALANTESLRQITGHWSPFFDTRLLDLHLTVSVADRVRYDPVNLALAERAPRLADIPHGWTGVPPARAGRYGPALTARKAVARLRHRIAGDRPPAPYLDHRPWMDEAALIRHHDFLERAIERNASVIASLPFLDRPEIDQCYRDHRDGANHWRALYALVTLLETPVARRIADGAA